MRHRGEKPQEISLKLAIAAFLICAETFVACFERDPPPKPVNKLPPPMAYSSADFANGYEGHTVVVDSFELGSKAEAYYLAGQLRAAQTRSFVILRPNKKLFVCVGNNKTRRQAESISKYLNSRYELTSSVLKPENKSPTKE